MSRQNKASNENTSKKCQRTKNMKVREVSQQTGIDQALISKFETGTRKPTRDQLLKLAAVLEIDLKH
ncbi:helix-turn-helix transcriptional regulator [Flavobacterium lindanitolerans]|nr:helix-turn-helix transcriptional regulator [Flavobacterium lindanitolerans]